MGIICLILSEGVKEKGYGRLRKSNIGFLVYVFDKNSYCAIIKVMVQCVLDFQGKIYFLMLK